MHIDIEWTKNVVRLDSSGKEIANYEPLPINGIVKYQWSVTASKQLGPHKMKKTKTVQQLGTPPISICRDLEHRVVRELEAEILFNRDLDAAGLAQA